MGYFEVDRGVRPIYLQVEDRIRDLVRTGALPAGTRIPSSRALAKTLGVSRNSVLEAYARLVSEGILEASGRTGTYVSTSCREAEPGPVPAGRRGPIGKGRVAALPLACPAPRRHDRGATDDLASLPAIDRLSAERFRVCLNYVLANNPHFLRGQGDVEGFAPLREWVSAYMRARGVIAGPEEILIVNGFEQGLALTCSALLRPGDAVAVESPGPPGTLACLRHAGLDVHGVDVGASGIDARHLDGLAPAVGLRMVCVTPFGQDPTGTTMDGPTRKAVLSSACAHSLVVVEDAVTDGLLYPGHLVPPLKAEDRDGHVIYIETVSRILFPGLRLAWLIAPRPDARAIACAKRAAGLFSMPAVEAAYYEFCRQGYLESHIARARRLVHRLREALGHALAEHMPQDVAYRVSDGGPSAWLALPDGLDSRELCEDARWIDDARRIAALRLVPGTEFVAGPGGERHLRITCASHSEHAIAQAVRTLAALAREFRGSPRSIFSGMEYGRMSGVEMVHTQPGRELSC